MPPRAAVTSVPLGTWNPVFADETIPPPAPCAIALRYMPIAVFRSGFVVQTGASVDLHPPRRAGAFPGVLAEA